MSEIFPEPDRLATFITGEGGTDFIVDAAEGEGTFRGFTDEEQPQAAAWLNEKFEDMAKRTQQSEA
jgi:hypothetical protein